MLRFEIIDHTADIGIKVYGKDTQELFENAAYGMFSLLTDLKRINPVEKLEVKVKGIDTESLLINWLNELNFLHSTKKMLFSKFSITNLNVKQDCNLSAQICGNKVDFKEYSLPFEIKSATYHDLKVHKNSSGYETTIIFDV